MSGLAALAIIGAIAAGSIAAGTAGAGHDTRDIGARAPTQIEPVNVVYHASPDRCMIMRDDAVVVTAGDDARHAIHRALCGSADDGVIRVADIVCAQPGDAPSSIVRVMYCGAR